MPGWHENDGMMYVSFNPGMPQLREKGPQA